MIKIQSILGKRTILAGLFAGATVLAVSAHAMSGGQGPRTDCQVRQYEHGKHHFKQQGNRLAPQQKRLANLKEKLQLQPEQEAAWQTLLAGMPGKASMTREAWQAKRSAWQAKRGEFAKLSTPERLDKMLERAEQRHAAKLQRVAALKQFYAQLSPEQQKTFDAQAQPGRDGAGMRDGRGGRFKHPGHRGGHGQRS